MAATKTKSAKKPAQASVSKNGAVEPADVLTLAEAAAYLRVSEEDVLNLVQTQDLAGRRIGDHWRFLKSSLQTWLSTPPQKFSKEAFLAMSGIWKDDPYLDEMLKEIYKRRGRPMTEEEE